MLSALIVAGYFHWAILPLPTAVRVNSSPRKFFSSRKRNRWGKGL
jgi:hypothetical protein